MKSSIKNLTKHFCLRPLIFSVALIWFAGCAGVQQHSDPLAGWKTVGDIGYKVDYMHAYIEQGPYNKAIIDDVQKFANSLPVYRDYHFF